MILDTSYLIDLFAGDPDAFEVGVTLTDEGVVQRVPAPVVMELSYGASFGSADEQRKVQNALRMYPVVEQDETIAHKAGLLLAAADRSMDGPSGIGKVDAMIAAVADHHDEPVLTADTWDFERLGVATESY